MRASWGVLGGAEGAAQMTTSTTSRSAMDEAAVNRLEASGGIATLASALRNIIAVTDEATHAAQAEANQRQEYVPTVLFKDGIYRAMDAALRGEQFKPGQCSELAVFDEEFDEEEAHLPAPDPADGTDYRPLARALRVADDEWAAFQNSISAEQDPDADYFVFVAQFAQQLLDSDAEARRRPVELRDKEARR